MDKRLLLVVGSALALAACGEVRTGHRGVFTHFGKVDPTVYSEGLYWYNPFSTSLHTVSTQTLKIESEVNTYTKDIQQADVKFVVTYSIDPNYVPVVYRSVGENWSNQLVPQVIVQSIKDSFGKWDAVSAIEHRDTIEQQIETNLRVALGQRHVLLQGFQLTNIQYSPDFESAVERKQVATQDAETAKNKTVQIQEESHQKVIAAQGEASAMQLTATALEANPKLVQYEAVRKWDGKLPQNMYGGSAVPFVDVGNK